MSRGMARANTLGGAGAPGGRSAKRKGAKTVIPSENAHGHAKHPFRKAKTGGHAGMTKARGKRCSPAGVGFVRKAHAKIEGRNRRRAMDAAS